MSATDLSTVHNDVIEGAMAKPFKPPVRPSTEAMINAIQGEAYCSRRRAKQLLAMLRRARDYVRANPDAEYFPVKGRDYRRCHDVLEMVMPDDTIPEPGSAFDLINQGLLAPKRDEVGFVHSFGSIGSNRYCIIGVEIQTL